jgi:hypothetical protein
VPSWEAASKFQKEEEGERRKEVLKRVGISAGGGGGGGVGERERERERVSLV